MNIKNIAGIAVLVLTVAFAIQLVQQNNAEAQSPAQAVQAQVPASSQSAQAVEFARLLVEENGEDVTWLIGGTDRVRTESVRAAYRRLGGTDRGTFSDLLNQIGAGGWNLVENNGNVWIFTRRAQ